jgi:hypothetical protein
VSDPETPDLRGGYRRRRLAFGAAFDRIVASGWAVFDRWK